MSSHDRETKVLCISRTVNLSREVNSVLSEKYQRFTFVNQLLSFDSIRPTRSERHIRGNNEVDVMLDSRSQSGILIWHAESCARP